MKSIIKNHPLIILGMTSILFLGIIYFKYDIRVEIYGVLAIALIGFIGYKTGLETAKANAVKSLNFSQSKPLPTSNVVIQSPIKDSCIYVIDKLLNQAKKLELETTAINNIIAGRNLIRQLPALPGGLFLGIECIGKSEGLLERKNWEMELRTGYVHLLAERVLNRENEVVMEIDYEYLATRDGCKINDGDFACWYRELEVLLENQPNKNLRFTITDGSAD